jgi:hypothetical protein
LGMQYTWKMALNIVWVFQTPWRWCESIIMVLTNTNLKLTNIDLVWVLKKLLINIRFIIVLKNGLMLA